MQKKQKQKHTQTAIIIPCYNEARRIIPAHFLKFINKYDDVNFIFVNDGSTDQTAAILTRLKCNAPSRVQVLHLDKNSGKQEAVRTGLNYALAKHAKIIGYWDADLAAPLREIPPMLRLLENRAEIQCVYGARMNLLGHKVQRTILRRAISLLCRYLAQSVLDLHVSDTQCGAKLFRATPELKAALSVPFRAHWLFDVELFARLKRQFQVRNPGLYKYPLSEWSEISGSNVSAIEMIKAGFTMLRLIIELRIGLFQPKLITMETGFTAEDMPLQDTPAQDNKKNSA